MDSIIATWERLPLWAKWVCGISGLFIVTSVWPALHERHFLSSFIEIFIANVLHWGLVIGSFADAIWGGLRVANMTGRGWLGWVAGLVIFGVIGVGIGASLRKLPGVGWRLDAMSNSDCYTDWDGRSNPTVCD